MRMLRMRDDGSKVRVVVRILHLGHWICRISLRWLRMRQLRCHLWYGLSICRHRRPRRNCLVNREWAVPLLGLVRMRMLGRLWKLLLLCGLIRGVGGL